MGLYEAANPYALSRGIMPLPGSPAYEALARNIMNSNPVNDAQSAQKATAMGAVNKIFQNTGTNYGMVQPTVGQFSGQYDSVGNPLTMVGPHSTAAVPGGGARSSGSSSMSSGAGLLDEILGLVRGTGQKENNAARSRLMEDYGQLRQQKTSDLARRGLFRAGVGEQELQREVDKPLSRGLSDLESNLSDSNVDVGLRKAAILGDIEAQARRAMSQQQAQQFASGSAMGSGEAYRTDKTGQGGIYGGMGGDGGMFGASFVDARKRQASGAAGGGDTMGFMPNVPYLGGAGGAGQSASQSWQALPANMGMQQIPQYGTQGGSIGPATLQQAGTYVSNAGTGSGGGYRLPSGAFVYGKR